MTGRVRLLTPGPSEVDERVLAAGAAPLIFHRDRPYSAVLVELTEGLRTVLGAGGDTDLFVFVASGTGSLECGLTNVLRPGDRAVIAQNGRFGERLAALARRVGAEVEEVAGPWGRPVDVHAVAAAVDRTDPHLVAMVHHESSTGVLNDVGAVGALCRARGPVFLVDAVSSAGAVAVDVEGWGVDVLCGASQKGLGAPPGLGVIAVSERARRAKARPGDRTFYFDWDRMGAEFARTRPESAWTPAVTLVRALHTSVELLVQAGIETSLRSRADLVAQARGGLVALGFTLLVPDGIPVGPVVVGLVPAGVDPDALVGTLRDEHGLRISPGQGPLRDRAVRLGLYGPLRPADVHDALRSIGAALDRQRPEAMVHR